MPPAPSQPVVVTPAGWYPDPHSAGILRYWDGAAWTDHRTPGHAQGQQGVYQYGQQSATTYAGGVTVTERGDGRPMVNGRPVCDPWSRLGAYMLDGLLMLVTLGIGWAIWACITAPEGQTPGKRILKQRVIKLDTGQPASFAWMLFMRGIVAGSVLSMSMYVLVGFVLVFMPFWDKKNQTLIDKISSTVVVEDGS